MSIENINQIQTVQTNIYGDYGLNGVSLYGDSQGKYPKQASELKKDISFLSLGSDEFYNIPINNIRAEAKEVIKKLNIFIDDVNIILDQVNINPEISGTLQECHRHIWDEIRTKQNLNISEELVTPSFINYRQYLYAEKHQCRGCRKFIKEYDQIISTTTFAHIYSFRKIVMSILNEAQCIQQSLDKDFEEGYEDESQQQAATYYLYWLKMATHYKRLFETAIPSQPTLLPESEVDQVTKKQAAQFQAFFSIRVNSETVSINNQLQSLSKDLIDDCNIFYERFLSPAIKFKTKVGSDLSLDFRTTNMVANSPRLAEEAITAVLAIEGNFKSLLTDLLERRNSMTKKVEGLYQSILQRRKYILYIAQLASKALSKNKIIAETFDQKYVDILRSALFDREVMVSRLSSSHSMLDDLGEDSHPQYLLKTGGTLSGNVTLDEGVTIDGIDPSLHAHDGSDGSVRIKAIDIDFDSVRDDYEQTQTLNINDIIDVRIDSFVPDILTGGTPVADVVLSINVPEYLSKKYDFEILYVEI